MTEDVQGIPNVQGLEVLVQDDPGQSQPQSATQNNVVVDNKQNVNNEPAKQTPTREELDLAQFGNDPQKLLKSYKEIQGAFTKTSQENKTLKEQMAQVAEQMELIRLSQMRTPAQPQQQQKDFDQMFLENPQKAVESLAEQKAQIMLQQSKVQDVLEEENLKSPGEFGERYNYAKMVAQQYPQLATSTAGVRKLFQIGDKLRSEQQRAQAFKAVKAVFGEDVDFEKFKQFIKKDPNTGINNNNNAYMPDISNSNGTRSDSPAVNNVDAAINEAVSKGDPDGVIAALFKKQGLR